VWLQFPLMVYVGLLGGASYVNIFYLLLHDPKITQRDKELAVNITGASISTSPFVSVLVLLSEEQRFSSMWALPSRRASCSSWTTRFSSEREAGEQECTEIFFFF
jgi:hypothetical protein